MRMHFAPGGGIQGFSEPSVKWIILVRVARTRVYDKYTTDLPNEKRTVDGRCGIVAAAIERMFFKWQTDRPAK